MSAPSLKELSVPGLEVGKVYTFSYLSASEGKPTGNDPKRPEVELSEADWKEAGQRIAKAYPKRYQQNVALSDRLGHVWTSLRRSKEIIAQIEARKKEKGIRLWDDYFSAWSEDKIHWDTAQATLEDCKRDMEEANKAFTSDDEREDGDPRIRHFFRFFDAENTAGEGAYETEAIYLGESLDRRNGNRRSLWLARKSRVSPKDLEKDFPTKP